MRNKGKRKIFKAVLAALLMLSVIMTACGAKDDADIGGQEKSFDFTVIYQDGEEESFDIVTDKRTVGEALLEEGLIDGEEGAYGLYVKTVNGVTLDYNTDGKYWAFYVDGEYAAAGVDATEIEEGCEYSFRAE